MEPTKVMIIVVNQIIGFQRRANAQFTQHHWPPGVLSHL